MFLDLSGPASPWSTLNRNQKNVLGAIHSQRPYDLNTKNVPGPTQNSPLLEHSVEYALDIVMRNRLSRKMFSEPNSV